jgi:membrane protease YdiL (CAAX protease family)
VDGPNVKKQAEEPDMRLRIYLLLTFAITWTAWWTLARQVPAAGPVMANPLFVSLYILGGFGPTLAAIAAVIATPAEGPFAEYGARLVRWRVHPAWYLAAFLIPPLVAAVLEYVTLWVSPHSVAPKLEPFARIAVLFPMMIVGGGLEELGWRGVAQPALERRHREMLVCAIVGVVWALWHLPLFFIHGVSQFGTSIPRFAVDVIGNAFLLGWLYANTRSILLCVLFHAASNTSSAMGLGPPDATEAARWIAECVKLAIGIGLVGFAELARSAHAGSSSKKITI